MKRVLALILAMMMILFAFASCADDESIETEEVTENQTESQTEKQTKKASSTKKNTSKSNNTNNGDNGNSNNNNTANSVNVEDWNKGTYTRDGDKITFGYYPQTRVTDKSLTATLSSMAGVLPTSGNPQSWTSYGYYIEDGVSKFMWYIDVSVNGEGYRGVYFTSYRPFYTSSSSSEDETFQDDNGYRTKTVYWFKYEPISWTILSENTSNGTALILCDMILDSQAFQNEYEFDFDTYEYYNTSNGVPRGTYGNNYEYSTIRKWLNETFYDTAFNELQKQIVLTTTVDNSFAGTGYNGDKYGCKNTEDKIFLLSAQEVTNASYGFASSVSALDTARQKKTTDYAKAQGIAVSPEIDYNGNAWWRLRTYHETGVRIVSDNGLIGEDDISFTADGIVPALQIKLS